MVVLEACSPLYLSRLAGGRIQRPGFSFHQLMSISPDPTRAIYLPSSVKLVYYAEGAANIVYKIVVPERNGAPLTKVGLSDSTQCKPGSSEAKQCQAEVQSFDGSGTSLSKSKHIHHIFHGKLLRLRKDQAHATAPLRSLHDFRKHIAPLFRAEELIQPTAVRIEDGLLLQLNAELKYMEQQNRRPVGRAGLYLRQEMHGTMMDDLGCTIDDPSRKIIELKPKWLLQSPDAPRAARRCRTCALRAFRASTQGPTEMKQKTTGFCPLHLVSRDRTCIAQALSDKFIKEHIPVHMQQHVVSYLASSTLLQQLRNLQDSLCPMGMLKADDLPCNINLLTLMTLRDCSLFLTVSTDGIVNAKLGDLDMKSPARIKYWATTERQLVDGRWYEKVLSDPATVPCALEGS